MSEDNYNFNFSTEGIDLDFDKVLNDLKDFSCKIIEKNEDATHENNEKIDFEAHHVIKDINSYYNNEMNFEKNTKIDTSNQMSKINNIYDSMMKSKIDRIEEYRNKFHQIFIGDPKNNPIPIKRSNSLKKIKIQKKLDEKKQNENKKQIQKQNNKIKKNIELGSAQTISSDQDYRSFSVDKYDYPKFNENELYCYIDERNLNYNQYRAPGNYIMSNNYNYPVFNNQFPVYQGLPYPGYSNQSNNFYQPSNNFYQPPAPIYYYPQNQQF